MDILRKGKLEIGLGRAAERGGGQMSQNFVYFGGLVMQMMQGFLADDASDAHHFGEDKFMISLSRCVDVLENLFQKVLVWYWCVAAELT